MINDSNFNLLSFLEKMPAQVWYNKGLHMYIILIVSGVLNQAYDIKLARNHLPYLRSLLKFHLEREARKYAVYVLLVRTECEA